MAATVRLILCLTNAVPGVLLLLAARSASGSLMDKRKTLKNFRRLQMIVLLGAFSHPGGLGGLDRFVLHCLGHVEHVDREILGKQVDTSDLVVRKTGLDYASRSIFPP